MVASGAQEIKWTLEIERRKHFSTGNGLPVQLATRLISHCSVFSSMVNASTTLAGKSATPSRDMRELHAYCVKFFATLTPFTTARTSKEGQAPRRQFWQGSCLQSVLPGVRSAARGLPARSPHLQHCRRPAPGGRAGDLSLADSRFYGNRAKKGKIQPLQS